MESALLALALLACPVGMGLMMMFMMRGKKSSGAQPSPPVQPVAAGPASVDDLRDEHARLSAEIDQLDQRDRQRGEGLRA